MWGTSARSCGKWKWWMCGDQLLQHSHWRGNIIGRHHAGPQDNPESLTLKLLTSPGGVPSSQPVTALIDPQHSHWPWGGVKWMDGWMDVQVWTAEKIVFFSKSCLNIYCFYSLSPPNRPRPLCCRVFLQVVVLQVVVLCLTANSLLICAILTIKNVGHCLCALPQSCLQTYGPNIDHRSYYFCTMKNLINLNLKGFHS